MSNPLISIIIPVYKVEKYLSECLDSVLAQTFEDWEAICVNDGSPDKCGEILVEYAKKDARIKVITQRNQGVAVTRNTGLKNIKGKYLFFLDSDDILPANALLDLYTSIEKNKSDISLGGTKIFNDDKSLDSHAEKMGTYLKFPQFDTIKINEQNMEYLYHILPVTPWNKLYSVEFIQKNNLTFINERCFGEDDGFWLKLLMCQPKISYVNKILYFYRIRPQSIMTSESSCQSRLKNDRKRILQDVSQYIQNQHLSNECWAIVKTEYAKINKKNKFSFYWYKKYKIIRIFGLALFRYSLNVKKKAYVVQLLGFTIFTSKKERIFGAKGVKNRILSHYFFKGTKGEEDA